MTNNTTDTELPSEPLWLLNLAFLVIGSVGFLINLLVCVVFLQRRMRRSYARHYSISLALGQMLYSVSAIIAGIPGLTAQNKAICSCYITSDHCGYYAGWNSIILLTAERFCAIKYPIFFKTLTRKRNIRIQLASVWVLAVILTLRPLLQGKIITIQLIDNGPSVQSCEVISGDGSEIFHTIYDIIGAILFFCVSFGTIHALKRRSTNSNLNATRENSSGRKPWWRLIFLNVMFFVCFVPDLVYRVLSGTDSFGDVVGRVVFEVRLLHTWINPIMHWACDTEFQRESRRIFCPKSKIRPILSGEPARRLDSSGTRTNPIGSSQLTPMPSHM